jgi:hypothetical protein
LSSTDLAFLGEENDVFEVDCLLARWGKNIFLLRWADGTYSWEYRRNIGKQLVCDFEDRYDGFCSGVEVLDKRVHKGKI